MPDIRALVKKLIADGESEDVIKAVIKKMDAAEDGSDIKSGLPDMSPAPAPKDEYTGPDTWMRGFKKSLFQKAPRSQFSEAMQAGGEGLIGNLESIKDIPANLAHGAKDMLDFHLNPGLTSLRLFNEFKQIPDIVKNAGADPRTFGRTLGGFTTTPLITEGLGIAAIRGPGAINRIPRVNKTLSSIGKTLEGTRHSNYVPTTPRGLVAGAVRGAVRPIGRAFSRAGERGRLAGSGVETANQAAARTTPNKPPNEKVYAGGGQGAVRNRPVRHDSGPTKINQNSEFTRPILESAEELAARKRPSLFSGGQSRRNQSTPFEPRPLDTTPYPVPGEIPPGIPGEAPLVRDTTPYPDPLARPPGIPPERPPIPTPNPIPVSEGGLSSRYRHRPYEPGQEAAAIAEAKGKPKTAPPPAIEPPFNPGNRTPPDLTQPVAPPNVDSPFGQVDPITGEIIPPLRGKKLQGKWNRPDKSEPDIAPDDFEFGPDEPGVDIDPTGTDVINDAGRQFADEIEAQRYPGDEAFDLGEIGPGFRQTSSMPDWGQQAPRPVNPLRPEVPPGQVTNRQMFENSAMRGAENPSPGRQFADSIGHEFDPDMMFTPNELGQPDIPPMMSPVENIFDPRTSNLPPRSEPRTIMPEEWGDWGPDADIPTLVPDESGSHVAAPREGPAEFSGRRQGPDTANDSGIEMLNDDPDFKGPNQPSAADTYPTNDINSPEGRRARYDYNANRVSPENRAFIDQLPDDALADFIDRQSQNPNYMNHDTGRDLVYHASDTQAMRASGDLVYESPEQARAFREPPRRQIVDWNERGMVNRPGESRAPIPQRRRAPERDIRYDEDTQNFFDRNAGYQDDVFDATPEEMARARGISDGSIPDPMNTEFDRLTGKTPKGQTLDEFEKPRAGRGRERLTKLFGEERADKLISGETEVATTAESQVKTDRPGGRKKIDDSTRRSWNNFERSELGHAGHDATKPGLTFVEPHSYYPKRVEMHYRDTNGKPIGILRTNSAGDGIVAFAVDSNLGLGRGNVVFKLINEAMDRGIVEASGSTSDLTRNLIERVVRIIKEQRARGRGISNDEGMFGNSEIELEINKILDGAADEFNTQPNESMGFFGGDENASFSNDAKNRLLEHPEGPAGERGKELVRATQYEVGPTIKDTIPDSLAEYHTFAEANPDYVKAVIPITVKRVADGLRKKAASGSKSLGEDHVPGQRAHTQSIVDHLNKLADDLEANPTPENIYRIRDEIAEFESQKNRGPRFETANDEGGRLVKKTKEKNFPSVIPEGFEKVGKGRQVGPRGASYRVKGPDGKHLGDINVTPKDIAEVKAMEQYAHASNESIATALYEGKLEAMLTEHGYDIHEPKITTEPKTTRTKDIPLTSRDKPMPATATGEMPPIEADPTSRADSGMYKVQTEEGVEFPNDTLAVTPPANAGLSLRRGGTPSEIPIGSEGMESISDFSGSGGAPIKTKPSAFKTTTEVKLNPDVDFGPNGDIKPILQEVRRLNSDNAADSRYRKLLPEIMRNELGPGETWRGKLERLIYEIQSEWGPEQGAQRLKEMDEFLKSAKVAVGREELPTDTPKLTRKLIDATKMKPGKINQQRDPWLSPKTWQDHPNFARRTKAEREKNKK